MKVRAYVADDLPMLEQIHARAGYKFPFPENIEDYLVLVDESGEVLMAAGEKMIPELTLICAPGGALHPLVKLRGIALLHEALRDKLVGKGHSDAIASVPPELERSYGRHLQRHFGWLESWRTYRIRDWKVGC